MRLYRPTWKGKEGQRRKSETWWLDFTDADNRRWRLPGLTDKRQTESLARNVEKLLAVRASGDALSPDLLRWLENVPASFRAKLAKTDLIDAERAGGLKPLLELDAEGKVMGGHLADFLADAEARGVSDRQRHMLGQRIADTLTRAKLVWLRDLSAARVQAAIAALLSPTDAKPTGLSKQSLTHYTRALKQFSRWLHRERRTAEDLLVGLRGYNAETDKRRERRGFTADEMAVLLAATRQGPVRADMTGPARAAAYALAFASGLRRNEIRTLTRASFNLAGDPPTVTVEAAYSKHRRQDVQPLPVDVAEILASHLAEANPSRPLPLPDKTAAMLREDMADARAQWISDPSETPAVRKARAEDPDFLQPKDSAGLVLDFHSFRHGYVTAICRANVSPRVMMAMARHSDPRLTMKRYSRVGVADTAAALGALPRLSAGENGPQAQQATGTDDLTARLDATERPKSSGPQRSRPQDQYSYEAALQATEGGTASPDRSATSSMGEAAAATGGLETAKTPANTSETAPAALARFFAKWCVPGRLSADPDERKAPGAEVQKTLETQEETTRIGSLVVHAPVAQLDRASVYGTEGYRFESCRVYFSKYR